MRCVKMVAHVCVDEWRAIATSEVRLELIASVLSLFKHWKLPPRLEDLSFGRGRVGRQEVLTVHADGRLGWIWSEWGPVARDPVMLVLPISDSGELL